MSSLDLGKLIELDAFVDAPAPSPQTPGQAFSFQPAEQTFPLDAAAESVYLFEETSGPAVDAVGSNDLDPEPDVLQGQETRLNVYGTEKIGVGFENLVFTAGLNAADSTVFDVDGTESIAFIVYVRCRDDLGGNFTGILGKRDVSSPNAGYELFVNSDREIEFRIDDGTNDATASLQTVGADGAWRGFGVVINYTTLRLQLFDTDGNATDIPLGAASGSLSNGRIFSVGSGRLVTPRGLQVAYLAVYRGAAAESIGPAFLLNQWRHGRSDTLNQYESTGVVYGYTDDNGSKAIPWGPGQVAYSERKLRWGPRLWGTFTNHSQDAIPNENWTGDQFGNPGAAFTVDDAVSPDGVKNAASYQGGTGTVNDRCFSGNIPNPGPTSKIMCSFWLRTDPAYAGQLFTVRIQESSGGTPTQIEFPLTDGWKRFQLTHQNTVGASNDILYFAGQEGVDTSKKLYIWGEQLETELGGAARPLLYTEGGADGTVQPTARINGVAGRMRQGQIVVESYGDASDILGQTSYVCSLWNSGDAGWVHRYGWLSSRILFFQGTDREQINTGYEATYQASALNRDTSSRYAWDMERLLYGRNQFGRAPFTHLLKDDENPEWFGNATRSNWGTSPRQYNDAGTPFDVFQLGDAIDGLALHGVIFNATLFSEPQPDVPQLPPASIDARWYETPSPVAFPHDPAGVASYAFTESSGDIIDQLGGPVVLVNPGVPSMVLQQNTGIIDAETENERKAIECRDTAQGWLADDLDAFQPGTESFAVVWVGRISDTGATRFVMSTETSLASGGWAVWGSSSRIVVRVGDQAGNLAAAQLADEDDQRWRAYLFVANRTTNTLTLWNSDGEVDSVDMSAVTGDVLAPTPFSVGGKPGFTVSAIQQMALMTYYEGAAAEALDATALDFWTYGIDFVGLISGTRGEPIYEVLSRESDGDHCSVYGSTELVIAYNPEIKNVSNRGIRVHREFTNFCPESWAVDNWSAGGGVTLTREQAPAPSGFRDAGRVAGVGTDSYASIAITGLEADTNYRASLWARGDVADVLSANPISIWNAADTAVIDEATVDLTQGVWDRVEFDFKTPIGDTAVTFRIYPGQRGVNTAQRILVWGMQVHKGWRTISHARTSGSQRVVAAANFGIDLPFLNFSQGALYMVAHVPTNIAPGLIEDNSYVMSTPLTAADWNALIGDTSGGGSLGYTIRDATGTVVDSLDALPVPVGEILLPGTNAIISTWDSQKGSAPRMRLVTQGLDADASATGPWTATVAKAPMRFYGPAGNDAANMYILGFVLYDSEVFDA